MNKQGLIRLYHKALFGTALMRARLTGKRVPLMANILITNRCNLNCFYCYVDSNNYQKRDIKAERLYELVDTLSNRGARLIVLLGGEPLLYDGIGKLIRYIKNKKMICEVITNGYLVGRYIDELSHCDSVCVSLDGDEKGHDENRGKGSHQKAVEAIALLQSRDIPVRIKAVITRNNKNCLDYLSRFARERDLMLTISTAATYDSRDYIQKDRWLGVDEKRGFFNSLLSLKKQGAPIGYSFNALNYILKWPYGDDFIVNKDCSNHTCNLRLLRCRRKDNSFYIDADGSMYPCAYQWGKNGKNVFLDGFDAAWQNMTQYDCYACGSLPDIDLTYLFNCNFENIFNAVKFFGKK